MLVRVAKYRLHKASGQALVEISGRRIYLGKHGAEESREKYRRLIAAHLSASPPVGTESRPNPDPLRSPKVNEVILDYFRHSRTYYVKNGKPTDKIAALRACLRRLRAHYGSSPVTEFGPNMREVGPFSLELERHLMQLMATRTILPDDAEPEMPRAYAADPTKILTRREMIAVLADLRRKTARSKNDCLNLVVFRLAACCGLRANEIAQLQMRGVHVELPRPHLRIWG